MKRLFGIAIAAYAAFGLARVASAQEYYGPESLAPSTQPPAVREDVAPAPTPEASRWVPGHYAWNGVEYVWIGGHYIQQPVNLYWQPGHWVWRFDHWAWINGHWSQ